jgi:hypothetical protein
MPMTTFTKMQAPTEKLTKGKIMMMNFRNMATMVNQFSFTFDFHDAFSIGKMEINYERKNKV